MSCQVELVGFSSVGKSQLLPCLLDEFRAQATDCQVAELQWANEDYSDNYEAASESLRRDKRVLGHMATRPARLADLWRVRNAIGGALSQATSVRRKVGLVRSIVRSMVVASELDPEDGGFVIWDEGVLQAIANVAALHADAGFFQRAIRRLPDHVVPAKVVLATAHPDEIVDRIYKRSDRPQWMHLSASEVASHQDALRARLAIAADFFNIEVLEVDLTFGVQPETEALVRSIAGAPVLDITDPATPTIDITEPSSPTIDTTDSTSHEHSRRTDPIPLPVSRVRSEL